MSHGLGIEIAGLPLLGIAGHSLRQGAAGTSYFQPGGVIIWDKPRTGMGTRAGWYLRRGTPVNRAHPVKVDGDPI
jgi:hypothetical protein